ncbi:MAG: fibronectin type III domain-containing protein [Deltaproteobacteria bacterium]|nr:fibronectin type III domain-containing protein [Deltaproteobacteria bacterium]
MNKRSFPHGPPSAPVDLVAVAVSGCQVLLAWTEVGNGTLGFRIERATWNSPSGPFAEIGGVGPHITAFRDGSVDPHAVYSYRVHAWNASGDSSSSNVVDVKLPQAGTDLLPE